MSSAFRLNDFDAEISKRAAPGEWARIAAFRDHPRFLDGFRRYHELILPYFANNVILNKVVTELWRFEMLVFALYLCDTRDPADPRGGLTAANLQRLCAERNIASPGRVRAIMGIMQFGGYIAPGRHADGRKAPFFELNPKFIGIVEGWNQRMLQIVDAIQPDGRLAESHAAHPRFGWEIRNGAAKVFMDGWRLMNPFSEVDHFVTRDGGWMLLLACMGEIARQGGLEQPGGGLRIAPVNIDLVEFGPRYGVSRSHLRRVLESAHAAGLLSAPPRNGAYIMLSPRLVASFLACMASEVDMMRALAHRARHALETAACNTSNPPV